MHGVISQPGTTSFDKILYLMKTTCWSTWAGKEKDSIYLWGWKRKVFPLSIITWQASLCQMAGFILAQNDDGPLKWAGGPYPIQIHANFQRLMGHSKILWALCKIWWAQESLISTLEHNWHEIWIACIWGPTKNKVHFSKTLIVFSQNRSGPS